MVEATPYPPPGGPLRPPSWQPPPLSGLPPGEGPAPYLPPGPPPRLSSGPLPPLHQSEQLGPVSGGGHHIRVQFNRQFYRTPPGLMGIFEVLCCAVIVTALSFRGFIFDVFFFLSNLAFTYALVGAMFFLNGLLGLHGGRDLPLLVAVQYYGLGFFMFLAAGVGSLMRTEQEGLDILLSIMAVLVAITLLVHVIHAVRNS
ncbi:uncharacterized protein LOC144180090 [Haemaphysalis longicornis]